MGAARMWHGACTVVVERSCGWCAADGWRCAAKGAAVTQSFYHQSLIPGLGSTTHCCWRPAVNCLRCAVAGAAMGYSYFRELARMPQKVRAPRQWSCIAEGAEPSSCTVVGTLLRLAHIGMSVPTYTCTTCSWGGQYTGAVHPAAPYTGGSTRATGSVLTLSALRR